MLRALVDNRLNVLLVAAPISWALAATLPASAWVFVTAAISLVPLAGLIGLGTEQLAKRAGPAWGGFLNATFGNAAELIIAIVALNGNHIALVQASFTGSIVGNLLLVLGLSFFLGGLGRRSQRFARTRATNATTMLFLAVVALITPAVYDLSLFGSLSPRPPALDRLSLLSAAVLIGAYAGSLIYSFRARRDLFRSAPGPDRAERVFSARAAAGLLAAGTILTTIEAEMLVGALEPVLARFGLSELFVGAVIVAVIGNAAEHYAAVHAARCDEMTLAVEIAVGSSAQIALLVAPAVVIYSFAIGRPMTLLFNGLEITAIALSVIATAMVVADGESNWVEGLQLMAVYLILALAFYLIPAAG
ncbi:MAG: calcium/proton exchanger [Acidobacteria bacterium]|nr:calcium/proton exchanger [Acidobacteriota bacterium]